MDRSFRITDEGGVELVPFKSQYANEWGFLQDFLSFAPDATEIDWTYSSAEELRTWLSVWDEISIWMAEPRPTAHAIRPLSSVWTIAAFMQPVSQKWRSYFYIDSAMPRADKIRLYREEGRELRRRQSEHSGTGGDPMGFTRGAHSNTLKECVHSNLFLWNDPISFHKEGWQVAPRWSKDDYDANKERLLNIEFLNIASCILYEGWRRYLSSEGFVLFGNQVDETIYKKENGEFLSATYDADLHSYHITNMNPPYHPLPLFTLISRRRYLHYQEVPFDLIAWDDLHDLTEEKWYYLRELGGPDMSTVESIATFLEGVEVNDETQLERVTYRNTFGINYTTGRVEGPWRSLYQALAGRELTVAPKIGLSADTAMYNRAAGRMLGQDYTSPGTESFSVLYGDKKITPLEIHSANLPLLYDSLLVYVAANATNADDMGLKRLIETDRSAPNYSQRAKGEKREGTMYQSSAWSLIAIINNWLISLFLGGPSASVKDKDVKKLVTYMGARIGFMNLLLITERFIELSEEGVEDVPLLFCEEVIAQSTGKHEQGFISLS